MKIGILTFHCAHNYGAVLQAYALQEIIKEMGHEVKIIDYRPFYLTESYKLPKINFKLIFSRRIIFNLLSLIFTYRFRRIRFEKFNDFINFNLNLSLQTCNIPSDFDLYIFGSDQIWNGSITKGIDMIYWGAFPTKIKSKKISYAASMGNYTLKNYQLPIVKDLISSFNGISVREKETKDQLQNLTSSEIFQVLDPTFLINKITWEQLIIDVPIKKKYVLIYQVRYNKYLRQIANDIAKQIKSTVIEVPANISKRYLFNKFKTTSPIEFISLIKNAECIVTSSFHGTALSIIFEKPFYTVDLNDGADNRSRNLLDILLLRNRMIMIQSKVVFTTIDYIEPNKNLIKLINSSKSYIYSFLND